MLYRPIRDILAVNTGTPSTSASTLTYKISRQPRRLDGIIVSVTLTVASAITLGTNTIANSFGLASIVDEIRLRITDKIGARIQTQVKGGSLLSWNHNVFGSQDRMSLTAYATSGFPSSGTVTVNYFVPIRDPRIAEPFANALSIPLDQLGEDATLEVSLNAITTVASAGISAAPTVQVAAIYRDVPSTVAYLPSELRTDTFVPTSTSNTPYEFANVGFLTGFLLQGWTTSTGARASTLASGGRFRLEYGRDNRGSFNETFMQVVNDLSRVTYPDNAAAVGTAGVLQARQFTGETMWDLISDFAGQDPFAVNSGLNLDSDALGGDKLRLFFNDYAATTVSTFVTAHRLLPKSIAELAPFSAGI